MNLDMIPFNIDLITGDAAGFRLLQPIKVMDIMEGQTKNFHPHGMFSVDIFGNVGSEKRNSTFAYIDIKLDVFHPVLFKAIVDSKALYGDIMAGKLYAIFDPELKDFVPSNAVDGHTGYSFFTGHYNELQLEKRPSQKREFNIKVLEKYKERPFFNKLLVLPAGLRDYEIDKTGKPSEDEVNKLYRKVYSITNLVDANLIKTNVDYFDAMRYNLQLSIIAIYNYFKAILEGKNGLVLGKWGKRKVFNSTRNVLTSHIPKLNELHDPRTVNVNQTVVGLYQYLRSILPLAVNLIRNKYLHKVFVGPNSPATVVNMKTLHKESVNIDLEYYDQWNLYEGIEKIAAKFGQEKMRHEPIIVDGYYLGLLYKGPDNTFKFIQDINEVPNDRDKKDVSPITYAEFLYMSVYDKANTVPNLITRYPITGYGSIYPSFAYLKTTNNSEILHELDEFWEPLDKPALEFPVRSSSFYNSMSVNNSHLSRLGG